MTKKDFFRNLAILCFPTLRQGETMKILVLVLFLLMSWPVYSQSQDYKITLSRFKQCVDYAHGIKLQALSFLQQNNFSEALPYFGASRDTYSQCNQYFPTGLNIYSTMPEDLVLARKDYLIDFADLFFQFALFEQDDQNPEQNLDLAIGAMEQALLRLEEGCNLKADEKCNGRKQSYYTVLGDAYRLRHDLDSALGMFLKADLANPNDPANLSFWGLALYEKGDYATAYEKWSLAATKDPTSPAVEMMKQFPKNGSVKVIHTKPQPTTKPSPSSMASSSNPIPSQTQKTQTQPVSVSLPDSQKVQDQQSQQSQQSQQNTQGQQQQNSQGLQNPPVQQGQSSPQTQQNPVNLQDQPTQPNGLGNQTEPGVPGSQNMPSVETQPSQVDQQNQPTQAVPIQQGEPNPQSQQEQQNLQNQQGQQGQQNQPNLQNVPNEQVEKNPVEFPENTLPVLPSLPLAPVVPASTPQTKLPEGNDSGDNSAKNDTSGAITTPTEASDAQKPIQ